MVNENSSTCGWTTRVKSLSSMSVPCLLWGSVESLRPLPREWGNRGSDSKLERPEAAAMETSFHFPSAWWPSSLLRLYFTKIKTAKSKEIQDEQTAVEALDGFYCTWTHRYPRPPLWSLWWGDSQTPAGHRS